MWVGVREGLRERIKRGVKGRRDREREARLRPPKKGMVRKERVKRAGEKNEGGVGGGDGQERDSY